MGERKGMRDSILTQKKASNLNFKLGVRSWERERERNQIREEKRWNVQLYFSISELRVFFLSLSACLISFEEFWMKLPLCSSSLFLLIFFNDFFFFFLLWIFLGCLSQDKIDSALLPCAEAGSLKFESPLVEQ